jgi:hypothetical protein
LVALVSQLLGTGISFLSLKIVSIAVGLATLPFLYLLGKELADRRVGLLAMILCGVAYWPDMISRIGLQLPLAMLFTAATVYFFLVALRRRRWNYFLWAGIALGIGLYGYMPIRIVPVVLALAVGLFLLHPSSKGSRWWGVAGFLLTGFTAFLLFIPFIRYAVDLPDVSWLTTITRIVPGQGNVVDPIGVFFGNLSNALQLFNWNDGVGWFNCVPLRPALDIVTGALFPLGVISTLVFFLRKRSWEGLFLILAIPVLLLPSVLMLAEPIANPSLARANTAVPIVFLLPALSLVMVLDYLRGLLAGSSGRWIGALLAAFLIFLAAAQNFDLTQRQYPEVYRENVQNASEIGAFIDRFAHSIGRYDDAFLVSYPYWVDDRLVSIYAGEPIDHSFLMQPENIAGFQPTGRPTLFLLLATDTEDLQALESKFPNGYWRIVPSVYPNYDFVYFLVPGTPDTSVQSQSESLTANG